MASIGADSWLELTESDLPIDEIYRWAVRSDCGAVVLFSGTVRDQSEGRSGVSLLTYEAYAEQVEPRLAAIASEMRDRWPEPGAIALLHRVGPLEPEESSVVVCVSSPHRPESFEAARFGIDAVKATVPIWKSERWDGGEDWGLCATELSDVSELGGLGDAISPAGATVSILLFLLAALILSAVGSAVVVMRGREPKGSETSVRAFEREMRALSPEARRLRSGSRPSDAESER